MIRFSWWLRLVLMIGVLLSPICPMSADLAQAAAIPGHMEMEDVGSVSLDGARIQHGELPCCAMHDAQEQAAARVAMPLVLFPCPMVPFEAVSFVPAQSQFWTEHIPYPATSPPFHERSQDRRE